jgi:hypothetical protein
MRIYYDLVKDGKGLQLSVADLSGSLFPNLSFLRGFKGEFFTTPMLPLKASGPQGKWLTGAYHPEVCD